MNYEEYKKHLEALGPLDEVSKGLLSAFELGYAQGLTENIYIPTGYCLQWSKPLKMGTVRGK